MRPPPIMVQRGDDSVVGVVEVEVIPRADAHLSREAIFWAFLDAMLSFVDGRVMDGVVAVHAVDVLRIRNAVTV